MKRTTPASLTLHLPEEFIALCQRDGVTPETVLRGFIDDVSGIVGSGHEPRSDDRSGDRWRAYDYYEQIGYPYWHRKP